MQPKLRSLFKDRAYSPLLDVFGLHCPRPLQTCFACECSTLQKCRRSASCFCHYGRRRPPPLLLGHKPSPKPLVTTDNPRAAPSLSKDALLGLTEKRRRPRRPLPRDKSLGQRLCLMKSIIPWATRTGGGRSCESCGRWALFLHHFSLQSVLQRPHTMEHNRAATSMSRRHHEAAASSELPRRRGAGRGAVATCACSFISASAVSKSAGQAPRREDEYKGLLCCGSDCDVV